MIQSVLSTMLDVIVPLSIPVVVGAVLVRFKGLETKHLLTLVLYYLTPAMVFQTLTTAEITFDDVYKTLLFCFLNLFLLWGTAKAVSKLFKLSVPETAGLTLISTMTNCVNYGIPLILLGFGQLGLDKASIYIVAQVIIINTVGVYFAARSKFSGKDAVKSVFSLPAIYAAILAILLRVTNLHLPSGVEEGIAMISRAFSPVVLTILGAQMVSGRNSKLENGAYKAFWSGMAARLLLSPLIAILCLYILDISGTLFNVLFVLTAMPVAVNSGIFAEKFDAASNVVSKCILWTTLTSFILLPLLIVIVE